MAKLGTTVKPVIAYILARLTERSTWVGLTGLISVVGVGLSPAHADAIAMVGAGVASLVQVAVKDRHPATAAPVENYRAGRPAVVIAGNIV